MRTKFLVVVFAVLAVGVWLLVMVRPRHSPPATNQFSDPLTKAQVTQDPSLATDDSGRVQTGISAAPIQIMPSVQNGEKSLNPGAANDHTLSALSNVVRVGEERYLEKAIRPIEFYGKVIDQSEQPIEGADAQFSRTYTSPPVSKKTDINGQFFLTGTTGRYLSVEVSKPGYYATKSNRMSFDYSPELALDFHRPDPNKPVIFELRKKGPGTELITSQYGMSPELKVQPPRDDTRVMVDLLNRKVGQGGQLQISQIKPDFSKNEAVKEWSFRMTIPDGGFVEHNDEFPFEAPESGYQAMIEFHFKVGETNWTSILKKQYYIVFGQPRRFGRLSLETEIIAQSVHLQYAINPDGTRNLEQK